MTDQVSIQTHRSQFPIFLLSFLLLICFHALNNNHFVLGRALTETTEIRMCDSAKDAIPPPIGEDVCTYSESCNITVVEKIDQKVVLTEDVETELCFDPSKGFRCPKKHKTPQEGTRPTYLTKTKTVTANVTRCCDGYHRTENTCEVCLYGAYGKDCAHYCNCAEPQICDNIIGCCVRDNQTCGLNYKEVGDASPLATNNAQSIGLWAAGLITICVFLFALVFYYRRKYQKERDPAYPVVTFYPDKTSLHNVVGADGGNSQSNGSSADGVITAPSRNQFANPLYGNAAAAKLEDYDYAELPLRDDGKKKGSPPPPYSTAATASLASTSSSIDSARPQNIYSSLDSGDGQKMENEYYSKGSQSTGKPQLQPQIKSKAIGNEYDVLMPNDTVQNSRKQSNYGEQFEDEDRYETPISPKPRTTDDGKDGGKTAGNGNIGDGGPGSSNNSGGGNFYS